MLSQELGHERRLHHSWEYRKFFNQSQVIRLSGCTVFRIPNSINHFRLGITMKARGSSIARNQVKRQVRESFRTLAPLLGAYDYNVVIPASKKLGHPYPKSLGKCLREELPNALSRS